MKKKMTFTLLSAFLVFLLSACGTSDDQTGETGGDHAGHEEMDAEQDVHPLTVDMQLPDKATVGEEVTIRTIVTMGDEIVEDADEVKYEIRNEAGDSEMIVAEFDGEESYPITKTFDEPGTYKVIPHTTARGQHTMPAKDIIIE
ncbi:FixH family protein [Bhargavaea ginsengi]|uniref:FixH family protein n=1 Tax=Bhargavaea ginsengi TaxID=426757 RepID=UPI00203DBA3A|nr:FixH family protein [Bhargavaea ginsengi]MCM3089250.1 FixH family protein [Bhargavaea ginsengi]